MFFKKLFPFLVLLIFISVFWVPLAKANETAPIRMKNWRIGGGLYWEYDSNIILDYIAPDIIEDQDAHSFNILLEGAYYPLLSKHFDIGGAVTLGFKLLGEYTDHSYFFGWVRLITQFKTSIAGMPFRILVAPGGRTWWVDHGFDEYTRALLVPVVFTLYETPNTATEFSYTFEWSPFDDDAFNETYIVTDLFLRTNWNNTYGLAQYFYFLDYLGYTKVGFDVNATNATNLYDTVGVRLYGNLRYPLKLPWDNVPIKMGKHLFLDFFTSYQYTYYAHYVEAQAFGHVPITEHLYIPEPIYHNPIQADVQRADHRVIVKPSVTYKIWGPFSIYLDYQMIFNSSSDVFYSYIVHRTSLGLYYEF